MRRTLLALLALALLGAAGPAVAATETVRDPRGDASGPLDVTSARFANGERRLVVRLGFAPGTDLRDGGTVLVSVDPRRGRGVTIGSEVLRGGEQRDLLLDGSVQDPPSDGPRRLDCDGLRVEWGTTTVRAVLPASCLSDGEYAALRFTVLVEGAGRGDDSDLLPDLDGTRLGSTGYVARG